MIFKNNGICEVCKGIYDFPTTHNIYSFFICDDCYNTCKEMLEELVSRFKKKKKPSWFTRTFRFTTLEKLAYGKHLGDIAVDKYRAKVIRNRELAIEIEKKRMDK